MGSCGPDPPERAAEHPAQRKGVMDLLHNPFISMVVPTRFELVAYRLGGYRPSFCSNLPLPVKA